MIKFITVSGIVVGMIATVITIFGTIAGEPDILGQFAVQIGEVLDKGITLLDKCIEQCFE